MLPTPVLFLVFNRPKETAVVFEAIRKAQPAQLFISADGPRAGRADDAANCQAVRDIVNRVDWECEVKTRFREQNLGCRNAVSDGITWFFNEVEKGIILEDDCLPHPDFFSWCENLLDYYNNNAEVMHIGGNNFQGGVKRGDGSYYFSKIPHIWGWASWRRAWSKYDVNMVGLESFLTSGQKKVTFKSAIERIYWLQSFKRVKKGEINTWDFQWAYTLMNNGGKAIIPQVNMVTNIGFGDAATHTGNTGDRLGKLETAGFTGLIHPSAKEINHEADNYWFNKVIPWQLKLKSAVKYFTGS